VRVYYSEVFMEHKPPGRHPENPGRLPPIISGVKRAGVEIRNVVDFDEGILRLAHDEEYVSRIKSIRHTTFIDGDTYVCERTFHAAVVAANAVLRAAQDVLKEGGSAYAVVRPPGHHAGRSGRGMGAPTQGFCIFNNVAITALALGEGVAVVDVDAHMGNGTAEILYDRDILYISTHQDPLTLYPGVGFPEQVGRGRGEGFTVNIPLPPGSGDDVYSEVLEGIVMPILKQYGPRIILVSLGWDSHERDPLTDLMLSVNSYLSLAELLSSLQVPIVYALEGGYDHWVLEQGSYALSMFHLGRRVRVDDRTESDQKTLHRFRSKSLREVKMHVGRYWRIDV